MRISKLNFGLVKKINVDFVVSSLIFIVAISTYLMTLAPTIVMEDSAEFIAAVATVGVAHPPGFPLYVIIGKLFTILIPFGSIAWKVNFMSAFFGASTITLVYLILRKLNVSNIIAFCSSLILAFSLIFWGLSVSAESYTMNSFFVALLLLVLIRWQENRKNSYLFWFAFLYGVSLTNHTMMSLLAPAYGIFIVLVDEKIFKKPGLILKMFLLACLGLSIYFFILIRSLQHPDFNFGQVSNFIDLINHVSRRVYNDFSPDSQLFGKIGLIISFFVTIYEQFFLPTIFLALGGLICLFKKNGPIALTTLSIFLFNSLGIIFLRKFGFGVEIDYSYQFYYLPCFLMIVVWFGVVIQYLHDKLFTILGKQKKLWLVGRLAVLIFVISLPISFWSINYSKNDMSDFWLNYDYAKSVLASLEPNSILLFDYDGTLQGDTEIFSYIYLKMVEGFRPDVSVVNDLGFFYKDYQLKFPPEYYKNNFEEKRNQVLKLLTEVKDRPLYTNFSVNEKTSELKLFSLSNGIVYKVYSSLEEARQAKPSSYLPSIRNIDDKSIQDEFVAGGLISHYYYNQAAFYLTRGEFNRSQDYLIKAFELDQGPFNHEYRRYLEYRQEWLGGQNKAKPAS